MHCTVLFYDHRLDATTISNLANVYGHMDVNECPQSWTTERVHSQMKEKVRYQISYVCVCVCVCYNLRSCIRAK